MWQYLVGTIGLTVSVVLFSVASGEEVTYEKENGVTYKVVRRKERKPVTTTQWEERTETVYKQRYVTEMRDAQRTVYSPVTEYRCEPRLHNWWNPFGRPYVAYHMRPTTRWESRVQNYETPVTRRELVPEERIVRTPVRKLRMEEREVVARVPVSGESSLASSSNTTTLDTRPVGGVSRLENDPPRVGDRVKIRSSQPIRR